MLRNDNDRQHACSPALPLRSNASSALAGAHPLVKMEPGMQEASTATKYSIDIMPSASEAAGGISANRRDNPGRERSGRKRSSQLHVKLETGGALSGECVLLIGQL